MNIRTLSNGQKVRHPLEMDGFHNERSLSAVGGKLDPLSIDPDVDINTTSVPANPLDADSWYALTIGKLNDSITNNSNLLGTSGSGGYVDKIAAAQAVIDMANTNINICRGSALCMASSYPKYASDLAGGVAARQSAYNANDQITGYIKSARTKVSELTGQKTTLDNSAAFKSAAAASGVGVNPIPQSTPTGLGAGGGLVNLANATKTMSLTKKIMIGAGAALVVGGIIFMIVKHHKK